MMNKTLPLLASLLVLFVSLGTSHAQPAASQIQVRAGFAVERVYVPKGQGSWVAMCFDDKGADLRVRGGNARAVSRHAAAVREQGRVQGGVGFGQVGPLPGDDLHQRLTLRRTTRQFPAKRNAAEHHHAPEGYRRDDRLDTAETLFTFPALTDARKPWWEHHVHGIVPGPDGKSLYIVGGDRDGLPCEKGRTPKHWNRDSWDFKSIPQPYSGGYVLKTDLDGKNAEWLCMGLRNCYDIAFNRLLSSAKSEAWTPALRERFFKVLADRAPRWKGGSQVKPKSESAMKAVVAMLSDEQRTKFAEQIAAALKPPAKPPEAKRPLVKEWKLEDLAPKLDAGLKQKRNLENGRVLYTATTCVTCHSFQGEGGLAGPDLSNVGGRYTPRDLLDNILNPSKVINEQYGQLVYELKSGKQVIGRLVETSGDTDVVATNPTNPLAGHVRINKKDVDNIRPSRVSSMPDGLLNTLTQDDVLDLLAYMLGR